MSAHPRLLSRLETFLASERGRRILNRFYSWGAAFVILVAAHTVLSVPARRIREEMAGVTDRLHDRQPGPASSQRPIADNQPIEKCHRHL